MVLPLNMVIELHLSKLNGYNNVSSYVLELNIRCSNGAKLTSAINELTRAI